jgi:Family of unknown function (DUF6533)
VDSGDVKLIGPQILLPAVLYHEYFLTLPREVAWMWRGPRRLSWLNIIFFINRYFILFGQVGVILRANGIGPLLSSPGHLQVRVVWGI